MHQIKVEIDEETLKRFENLPKSGKSIAWRPTEEQKQLLLRYWPIKNHCAVAKQLGVSSNTALKCYRALCKAEDALD